MANKVIEFALLNGLEAILYILFCTQFNIKSLAKGRLFLAWFVFTALLYFIPIILFEIPYITQFLIVVCMSISLNKIFDIDRMKLFKRCLLMMFAILLCCEVLWHIIYTLTLDMNVFTLEDNILKFLLSVPVRIFELFIIFYICKYETEILEAIIMAKSWFFGLFTPKKETEKKEVEKK